MRSRGSIVQRVRPAKIEIAESIVTAAGRDTVEEGWPQAADPQSLSERERAFSERMQNVVLIGNFTIEGRDSSPARPERYEISSVTKLDGNRWRFNARVQYATVDVTVPVVIPVLWAGNTPIYFGKGVVVLDQAHQVP